MARVDRAGFGAAPLEVEVENVEQGVATLGRLQNHVDGATDERRDERETARLEAAALVFEEIAGQLDSDLLGLSERKGKRTWMSLIGIVHSQPPSRTTWIPSRKGENHM